MYCRLVLFLLMCGNGGELLGEQPLAKVVHIGASGVRLIGIEIQDRTVLHRSPERYHPQDGDEVSTSRGGDKGYLGWVDGEPARMPGSHTVKREGEVLGTLAKSTGLIWRQEIAGVSLDLAAIDLPEAYRVRVDGRELVPTTVFRKSKPNGLAHGGDAPLMVQHFIYLQLPEPLVEGKAYTIEFLRLNTEVKSHEWLFDSVKVRSEAIHLSHIGYRANDPFKRGYVSLWAGTGGGQTFDAGRFHLLNEAGDSVFEGDLVLGVPADQSEPFRNARNHTGADVFHADFSSFDTPGRYRLRVPGLGVSYPFTISDEVWEEAFRVAMMGLLHHRSGIELGPPVSDYRRPRGFHPDDDVKVYETDVQLWDGESGAIRESLTRLLGAEMDVTRLKMYPDAWGGYMDAGDWDRRSQHLVVSLRQLELFEMFPEYFSGLSLALPPEETANAIPDLLDEVRWQLDFFRRLQDDDGGVRGGVESTAHPLAGERSWEESLFIGVYRADPLSSYRYAATAARYARLLPEHEDGFAASALRAWEWAEQHREAHLAAAIERGAPALRNGAKEMTNQRAIAAIESYRLSGEERFRDVFSALAAEAMGDTDVLAAYAFLDDPLGAAAVEKLKSQADQAIAFSEKNGFNLALVHGQYLPMMGFSSIWSTPGSGGSHALPRAHFHTGKTAYLAGLVASTQYCTGANPMNMSYTTGIGPADRQPRDVLHLDSRRSGQAAPVGITVYGQSDPSADYAFNNPYHKRWPLNLYGGVNSRDWPTAEAYVDLGNWPSMTEYTVHQTFSPTQFAWGYLAARP